MREICLARRTIRSRCRGAQKKSALAAFKPQGSLPRHEPSGLGRYLSAVETLVKVVLRLEPVACTTAMMATAMPAAMRAILDGSRTLIFAHELRAAYRKRSPVRCCT
jgi:hypothetical protein